MESEGIFAPARSSRGTLAHCIHIKDLTIFERRKYVVVVCRGAEANILLGDEFDVDAEDHQGFRTCEKCVRAVRSHIATKRFLAEWLARDA